MNTNSVEFFKRQKNIQLKESCNLTLMLWELNNAENIGHIIRVAHNVGAQKALFVSDEKKYRKSKIEKIAGFSYNQMNWQFIAKEDAVKFLQAEKENVYALETCDDAQCIFRQKLPEKLILLAGNESKGIPLDILEYIQHKVYIPMPGKCKSMNISHSVSVAVFEWLRQNI